VPQQVLFIRNDPTAPEALLGDVFTEYGFEISIFDVVPPDRADDPHVQVAFPEPSGYDVIVPLGARWAAYDDNLPWITAEMDMTRHALACGVGVLGVCFGGQLLARALGGTVARSPRPEIGWHEVRSTRPDLVPSGPWFQWHFDRFTAPPGAVEVAGNDCATQAFIHGRAVGLQFHPEVDGALVERWIAEDADDDIGRLGLSAQDLRARTGVEVDAAARRLRLLVRGFLTLLTQQDVHQSDRLG
jgi:GMP synthase-like glutamine amidotransferase